jgi:dGTP triphosphohydrolase
MKNPEIRIYLTADSLKYLFENSENPNGLKVAFENSAKNYARSLLKDEMAEKLAQRFKELADLSFSKCWKNDDEKRLEKELVELYCSRIQSAMDKAFNQAKSELSKVVKKYCDKLESSTDAFIPVSTSDVESLVNKKVQAAIKEAFEGLAK